MLPLGGLGEIGMNLMVYECDGEMIVVDAGITFPDNWTPGVDVVLPDIAYIRENIKRLKAIIITHAHEDHIGAMPYLWEEMPVPVYLSRFARMVLDDKMRQVGLDKQVPVHEVIPGKAFKIGKFELEFANITHSIPESHSVMIRTPYGNLLHTGDYKFDPAPTLGDKSDEDRLKSFGDEGVLAMMGDSTNIFYPKTSGAEGAVQESLDKILNGRKNRVYFCTFASNVGRVKTALELALKHKRKVALWGRSMQKMLRYARDCGYIEDALYDNVIDPFEAMKLPRNKVLVLVTGSQGESRAALAKLANGDIGLELTPGDTVILSSKIIPGNERVIYNLMNKLTKIGAEIVHEKSDFVHVSGHAARDEISHMYALIRPEISVPVHGEYQHLKAHADFAKELGVKKQFLIENGTRLYLGPDKAEIVKEDIQHGRNYVDGLNILDEDRYIIRDRRNLASDGVVMVSAAIDMRGRQLAAAPIVRSMGIIDEELQADLIAAAVTAATSAAKKELKGAKSVDAPSVEEAMRVAVRRLFKQERGRKPITVATVVGV